MIDSFGDRITRWNGQIYGGEIIGMIAAYFYFRKKRKDEAEAQRLNNLCICIFKLSYMENREIIWYYGI